MLKRATALLLVACVAVSLGVVEEAGVLPMHPIEIGETGGLPSNNPIEFCHPQGPVSMSRDNAGTQRGLKTADAFHSPITR